MLRMIGSNSGDFVCTQVLHNLWKLFLFKKFTLKTERNKRNETVITNHARTYIHENDFTSNTLSSEEETEPKRATQQNKMTSITKIFKDQKTATAKRNEFNPKKLHKAKSDAVYLKKSTNYQRTDDDNDGQLTYTELKRKSRASKAIKQELSDYT